jgi:cell division protease FtsH
MALGITQTLPEKDSLSLTKSKAENMIAFLFGGRAAEEIIYKDVTTGAGNDIERATEIARRMVCEWGMSEKLGPLSYEKREGPVFLGMQYGNTHRDYSDSKAQEIDAEVFRIINEGYQKAKTILVEGHVALEALTQALLEFETIDSHEVELLVNGGKVEEIHKLRENAARISAGISGGDKVEFSSEGIEKAKNDGSGNDPVGGRGPLTV